MKKIERISPPDCLNNCLKEFCKKKIGFYENLRDNNGKIYPRWNTACKNGRDVSQIRERLLKMSSFTCVFCGENIKNSEMDVDHYLPKSNFPHLAYCWDNMLPTCKLCNQTLKKNFIPASLKDSVVVEDILSDMIPCDYVYEKKHLLQDIAGEDRLLDPTFDEPEEHMEFIPESYSYKAKTKIGRITARRFFNRHKEVAEKWEAIRSFIKDLVLNETPKCTIAHYIKLHGREYICWKFYEYWCEEKEAGRIDRT
ncbi:HNH endonuclease [Desulfonema ishimotonii]|uniref:HNH endonuclease n=1 Tax=Desulfonema ishimotonii TaxID=45657 RepID=A0A401G410_9BACT|nr:HNH endonuclease [Desulfonema ishimotonii]GBC63978.1 HNH endonuclease [Desulfonema ishimotonii]